MNLWANVGQNFGPFKAIIFNMLQGVAHITRTSQGDSALLYTIDYKDVMVAEEGLEPPTLRI